MKINKFKRYVLFLILVIASLLRILNLSTNPPHLSPDEASLGYNAYSILKTGRDEYGTFMPIIFKSFGDYKPGLYIYTTVPFVAVLGLNEWSVRLPSAVSGIVAVLFLYLIVKKLVTNTAIPYKDEIPLVASFFLAVAPWHVYFSRGAWEINLALTLTLAGIYFLFTSFERPFFILMSSLFFSLTFLTYQGAKLATVIVILSIVISYFSEVRSLIVKNMRLTFISGLVAFLIASPILLSLVNGQAGRLTVMSIFSYPRSESYIQTILKEGNENFNSLSYYMFHSETVNFVRSILGRWLNHYSGRFLFFEGDWVTPKQSTPYHGVFTLFDMLFFIPGIFVLLYYIRNSAVKFAGIWFLLAPLPAALSKDEVHAVRAYNLVIPIVIIITLGCIFFITLIQSIKKPFLRYLGYILVAVAYSFSYLYFIDLYFVHNPYNNAKNWDYGQKQVVEAIRPIYKNYPLIKVQQSFSQPYIYFLFYGLEGGKPYDPASYQKQAILVPGDYKNDVGNVLQIDTIFFLPINWPQNREERGVLFVGDEIRIPPYDSENPELFDIKKDIAFPNGERAFRVVEVKSNK